MALITGVPEAAIVEEYGGRVTFLPLIPGISTTGIEQRILRTGPANEGASRG